MKITVISYSYDIDRTIIETMQVNPQTSQELDSILRDACVVQISDEQIKKTIADGALDLRTYKE